MKSLNLLAILLISLVAVSAQQSAGKLIYVQ